MSWIYSRALILAYENSRSSLAPAAAYLAANCSDGEQSAPSSGTHTPLLYCAPGRMTEFSRLSRFGMTFKPSTELNGADVLTWFLAGFLARIYQQQAKAQESTESDQACGSTWRELLARYDHVSRSWRTPQCSLLEGLDVFSETWPRWGMMRDGACFLGERPALGIFASESGWWLPTIGKNEYRGTSKKRFRGSPHFRGAKMCEGLRTCSDDPTYLSPLFAEDAMGWPHMWSALAPLETDKFQQWQHSHGIY